MELPLQPFLLELAAENIAVTPRDYQRINLMLRCGGVWTLARLHDTLMALLVRDRHQQEAFRRCWPGFFGADEDSSVPELDVARALAELRSLAPDTAPEREAGASGGPVSETITPPLKPPRRWPKWLRWAGTGLAVVAVALAGWVGWTLWQQPAVPPVAVPSLIPKTETTLLPDAAPTPTPEVEVQPGPLTALPGEVNWRDALVLFPLLWAPALWAWWRWREWRQEGREQAQEVLPDALKWDASKELHFQRALLGGPPASFLDERALDDLADALGHFLEEGSRAALDVFASVEATGERGGLPTLIFQRPRRLRRVYILEDEKADATSWNTTARELVRGLRARGLQVVHGTFRGTPAQWQTEEGAHRLEDLAEERDQQVLLLFSDSQGLRPQDVALLREVSDWPQRAWLEWREERAWDYRTALVAKSGVPVFPATAEGLQRALAGFGEGPEPEQPPSGWRGFPPGGPAALSVQLEYLLGDALLWAQACAMAQQVTRGLADKLRCAFTPELPPGRWERLLLLPDTYRSAAGLHFSDAVLSVLRAGFAARRGRREQEAVLRCILAEIAAVEPPDRDSPAHAEWEMIRELARLESDPDAALPRLTVLAETPLGGAIRAYLANKVLPGTATTNPDPHAPPLIPLQRWPQTPSGMQQLARLAERIEVPQLEVRPARLDFGTVRRGRRYVKKLRLFQQGGPFPARVTTDVAWLRCEPAELTIGTLAAPAAERLFGEIGRPSENVFRRLVAYFQEPSQLVKAQLEPQQIGLGVHEGLATVTTAGGSCAVPVRFKLARSRREKWADWWKRNYKPLLERLPLTAWGAGLAVVILTALVLPANWFNRLYNRPPQLAQIGAGYANEEVALTAQAHDPEGGALSYEWTVNGQTQADAGPQTKVARSNKVQVMLRLRDNRGGQASYRQEFDLLAHAPPPTATPSVSPTPAQTPTPGVTPLIIPGLTPAPVTPTPGAQPTPVPSPATANLGQVEMKFVYIPPGRFIMGSPKTEAGHADDETQHEVTLTKGFWLGQTEVTQAQWQAVMVNNPSEFQQCGPTCPVEGVSWNDVQQFIGRLNARKDGYIYRLPTEAEWEYAARAGTTGPYAGNLEAMAWYDDNSKVTTHPVATKQPNAWGLYDMHGNVWEWVQDWYGNYPGQSVTDPSGPGRGADRVGRGGSWVNTSASCRSAIRFSFTPDGRYSALGFRLSRTPM